MSATKPEVIVVERAEGCDCGTIDLFGGMSRLGRWNFGDFGGRFVPCPHGSVARDLRAEDIPAGLVALKLEALADQMKQRGATYPTTLDKLQERDDARLLVKAARRVREAEKGAAT